MGPDRRDEGSGAVLVLAVLLVAATGLVTVAWLAAALHAQARLRAAADLAALAAAERSYLLVTGPGACPEQVAGQAAAVAAANRARLAGCRTEPDGSLVVTVAAAGRPVRGAPARVSARAGLCQDPPGPGQYPSGPAGDDPREVVPGSVDCHSSS